MTNLILTGFMGTGKTTIGQIAAEKLGRSFVDMDVIIRERANKSIEDIFSEDGETAFRQMEYQLCVELSQKDDLVISTGGGTLVSPQNRSLLQENGIVICLSAESSELYKRMQTPGAPKRPLLFVDDPISEINRLIQVRDEAYSVFPWQVETTHLSLEETTQRVVELSGIVSKMVTYPGGKYPIHTGTGLLNYIGSALRSTGARTGSRVAVVTNTLVAEHYFSQVQSSISQAGLIPILCLIPDGEQHKTLDTVSSLYDQFLIGKIDRSDCVLSLGGGVTGDIAGFAASTYMRGVSFAQVPTTLLAMVDASVGGKTGVDLPQGKNLVGAFKQPVFVLIDPVVLKSLDEKELRSGLAEVIKHCVIGDSSMFSELESSSGKLSDWWQPGLAAQWITRSLSIKVNVVEADPFEHNQRAILNLGHTIGHAVEKISHYSLRHGEAVSIGMVAAARISDHLHLAEEGIFSRLEKLLTGWGLPISMVGIELDEILNTIEKDKKKKGSEVLWVLPISIGKVVYNQSVPHTVIKNVLSHMTQKHYK